MLTIPQENVHWTARLRQGPSLIHSQRNAPTSVAQIYLATASTLNAGGHAALVPTETPSAKRVYRLALPQAIPSAKTELKGFALLLAWAIRGLPILSPVFAGMYASLPPFPSFTLNTPRHSASRNALMEPTQRIQPSNA